MHFQQKCLRHVIKWLIFPEYHIRNYHSLCQYQGRSQGEAEGAAAPPLLLKERFNHRRRQNAKDQVNGKNNVEMLTVSKIGERNLRHFKALTSCRLPNFSHSQTRRNYIFDVKRRFLRLLKTYLRNRTTEDRLNGLTMI